MGSSAAKLAYDAEYEHLKTVKPTSTKHQDDGTFLTAALESFYTRFNILIMGTQHTGKSSFINRALRILNDEWNLCMQQYASSSAANSRMPGTLRHTEIVSRKCPISFHDTVAPQSTFQMSPQLYRFFNAAVTTGVRPPSTQVLSPGATEFTISPLHRCYASILVINAQESETNLQLNDMQSSLFDAARNEFRKPIIVLTHSDLLSTSELNTKIKNVSRRLDVHVGQIFPVCNCDYSEGAPAKVPHDYEQDLRVLRAIQAALTASDDNWFNKYSEGL
jgi:GTP-binding protein EngB required for normal cell division